MKPIFLTIFQKQTYPRIIKFFRLLRQGLLSENQFSKYLLYAIGEIVLVVIGILLALQISNWNEERKTQSAETDILQRLQLDLRDDINVLEHQVNFKKNMIDNYKICLEILSEDTIATKEEFKLKWTTHSRQ